jgi:eukaryotic-like serine/threonine-protein kinase
VTHSRAVCCSLALLMLAALGAAHGWSLPSRATIVPEDLAPPVVEPFPGMVKIDAAQFVMGTRRADRFVFVDERPWPLEEPIPVQTPTFFLDRTEVTNAAYAKCVATGPCRAAKYAADPRYNAPDQPVVGVSWHDARTYCQWAEKRLPRETEWELAARLGAAHAAADDAPHAGNRAAAQPVGQGAPNPVGALDMLGNAWEWCADWYHHPPKQRWEIEPLEDEHPPLFLPGRYRVLRGGGWNTPPADLRPTLRFWWYPERRGAAVGFRCAMDPYE